MLYREALVSDLIGAPEFILGVIIANKFRKCIPDWKQSSLKILLAVFIFITIGLCGTTLRTLLMGQPYPGFISFGFGFAIIYPFD